MAITFGAIPWQALLCVPNYVYRFIRSRWETRGPKGPCAVRELQRFRRLLILASTNLKLPFDPTAIAGDACLTGYFCDKGDAAGGHGCLPRLRG